MRAEALLGVGFVLFGGLMLHQGLDMPALAHIDVGPGLFPAIVGGLMIAMGGALAVRAAFLKPTEAAPAPTSIWPVRPLLFLGYLLAPLAYLALTPLFGFLVTASVIVAALALVAGARATRAVLLGLAVALVIHLVFARFMRVPLPYGIAERLLAGLPWL